MDNCGMRILWAAIVPLFLCACATTEVQLLIGPRVTNQDSDTDLGATLLVLQQIGQSRVRCGYVHESELNKGRPFNERDERTFDQLGCGPRWGGK